MPRQRYLSNVIEFPVLDQQRIQIPYLSLGEHRDFAKDPLSLKKTAPKQLRIRGPRVGLDWGHHRKFQLDQTLFQIP